MISIDLTSFSIIFTLAVLFIGSWQDIHSREVTDLIWYILILGGIIIHLFQIRVFLISEIPPDSYIATWISNIGVGIFLVVFLTIFGLGGEADRIAFLVLAIISPINLPIFQVNNPNYSLISSVIPNILGTFFNAYFITLPVPLIIFLFNLFNQIANPKFYNFSHESKLSTFFLRFIGYPKSTVNLETLLEKNPWHFDFLEDYKEESGWFISYRIRLDTPEEDLKRKKRVLKKIQATNKSEVWIQPTFPFILLITLGYTLNVFWGNLIFLFVALLF
ncbi:MAG: hypothetical protein EAX86_00260 [Candidatus Heimdallarchaeota archaeon]|nr:hypothetical protein [Candidatus Heimdallarchaeota archaeon]